MAGSHVSGSLASLFVKGACGPSAEDTRLGQRDKAHPCIRREAATILPAGERGTLTEVVDVHRQTISIIRLSGLRCGRQGEPILRRKNAGNPIMLVAGHAIGGGQARWA